MNDEELERRINSAIMEEEEAKKICDYIIDATQTEEEVLDEVLSIIKND
jgi:dephospho-CoA kinase